MSIETAVKASNGNGVEKPVESPQNGNSKGLIKPLETDSEKKERTRSLVIVYFTLFLQSLGLASTMTGVWPFLDKVSHSLMQIERILLSTLIYSSIRRLESHSSVLSWRQTHSGSSCCLRFSDTGRTKCLPLEFRS